MVHKPSRVQVRAALLTACVIAPLKADRVITPALQEYAQFFWYFFGPIFVDQVAFVFIASFSIWFGLAGLFGSWIGLVLGAAMSGAPLLSSPLFAFISIAAAVPTMLANQYVGRLHRIDSGVGFAVFMIMTTVGHEAAQLVLVAIDGTSDEFRWPGLTSSNVMGSLLASAVIGYPLQWLFSGFIRRHFTVPKI
jgi:hypothetical protein